MFGFHPSNPRRSRLSSSLLALGCAAGIVSFLPSVAAAEEAQSCWTDFTADDVMTSRAYLGQAATTGERGILSTSDSADAYVSYNFSPFSSSVEVISPDAQNAFTDFQMEMVFRGEVDADEADAWPLSRISVRAEGRLFGANDETVPLQAVLMRASDNKELAVHELVQADTMMSGYYHFDGWSSVKEFQLLSRAIFTDGVRFDIRRSDTGALLMRSKPGNLERSRFRTALSAAHRQNHAKLAADECGEGCFLTTATAGLLGLADDCWELRTLRRFRDTVLRQTAEGKGLVERYYQTAPEIVRRISARGDQSKIWSRAYLAGVLPAAVLARLGFNKLATKKYASLHRRLAKYAAV